MCSVIITFTIFLQCPIYDLDVTCKVIVKDILGEFPRHCDEPNVQIKLPIAQVLILIGIRTRAILKHFVITFL